MERRAPTEEFPAALRALRQAQVPPASEAEAPQRLVLPLSHPSCQFPLKQNRRNIPRCGMWPSASSPTISGTLRSCYR